MQYNLSGGKLTGWSGTINSKAVRALAARLVQRQRIFVTTPWLCLLVLCLCVYISALSGSTLVCRVIILLELSEVPPFEPVARSVRIQLAVRACCSVVGRRCRPQLGIAFRYSPADEHLFVVVVSSRCPSSR